VCAARQVMKKATLALPQHLFPLLVMLCNVTSSRLFNENLIKSGPFQQIKDKNIKIDS